MKIHDGMALAQASLFASVFCCFNEFVTEAKFQWKQALIPHKISERQNSNFSLCAYI